MSFVNDGTPIPGPKTQWDEASSEAQRPDMYLNSADYEVIRQALLDIRDWLLTGLTPGTFTNVTAIVDADGRIVGIASGAAGIADGSVTNAKLANMPANTVKLNNTGGSATPIDGTIAQLLTMLNLAAIAISGSGADLTADSVVNAKLANMPANTIKLNNTGSSAVPIDGTVSQLLVMLGLAAIATSGSGADLSVGTVTNAKLANMPAGTVKANLTGGSAAPADNTTADLASAMGSFLFAGAGYFGAGFDGAVAFDGVNAVTGWTRSGTTYFPISRPSWYFTTVVISGGVTLVMEVGGEGAGGGASSEFYASVSVTVPSGIATIKHNGASPTTNAQVTNMVTGHTGATTGQGAGGNQNAGTNANNFSGNWYNSRKCGAGGFGGASATNAGSSVAAAALTTLPDSVGLPGSWEQAKLHRLNVSNPGAASGGAGGGSGGGTTGVASGGAGGNGGGVMTFGARQVLGGGTLRLEVKGGNGAPGVAGAGSNTGGGSGGGGGEITVGVGTTVFPSNVIIDRSGGTGGAPQGTGSVGGNGSAGQQYLFTLGLG